MNTELIREAIKKYEAENRRITHPSLQQSYIKDDVIVLKNITGVLAKYRIDELTTEEVTNEIDSDGTE